MTIEFSQENTGLTQDLVSKMNVELIASLKNVTDERLSKQDNNILIKVANNVYLYQIALKYTFYYKYDLGTSNHDFDVNELIDKDIHLCRFFINAVHNLSALYDYTEKISNLKQTIKNSILTMKDARSLKINLYNEKVIGSGELVRVVSKFTDEYCKSVELFTKMVEEYSAAINESEKPSQINDNLIPKRSLHH